MSNLSNFLSTDSLFGALAATLLASGIIFVLRAIFLDFQASIVYKALRQGLHQKGHHFLPSSYLSAKTGYPKEKIELLCSRHKKIKRNQKNLETWTIE
jgi:hypothetical protein